MVSLCARIGATHESTTLRRVFLLALLMRCFSRTRISGIRRCGRRNFPWGGRFGSGLSSRIDILEGPRMDRHACVVVAANDFGLFLASLSHLWIEFAGTWRVIC